jgi:hypothetical protein
VDRALAASEPVAARRALPSQALVLLVARWLHIVMHDHDGHRGRDNDRAEHADELSDLCGTLVRLHRQSASGIEDRHSSRVISANDPRYLFNRPEIEVIYDRRRGKRRRTSEPPAAERRRADRRVRSLVDPEIREYGSAMVRIEPA